MREEIKAMLKELINTRSILIDICEREYDGSKWNGTTYCAIRETELIILQCHQRIFNMLYEDYLYQELDLKEVEEYVKILIFDAGLMYYKDHSDAMAICASSIGKLICNQIGIA